MLCCWQSRQTLSVSKKAAFKWPLSTAMGRVGLNARVYGIQVT